jgi:hypothetical protein
VGKVEAVPVGSAVALAEEIDVGAASDEGAAVAAPAVKVPPIKTAAAAQAAPPRLKKARLVARICVFPPEEIKDVPSSNQGTIANWVDVPLMENHGSPAVKLSSAQGLAQEYVMG